MNHIYRSLWNAASGTCVAVSELSHASGRAASAGSSSVSGVRRFRLNALALVCLGATGLGVQAQPTGGVVAAGTASIHQAGGNTTITQGTPSAVINWQGFSVAPGQAVQFVQPDARSVALNRVLGPDPSAILGSLSANGRVFLVNPNGVLFGKGASINVGGLVASTLNISDSAFMAGRYRFAGNSNATVRNEGHITTTGEGGSVVLLGAQVANDGSISARRGSVALAAGSGMTLDVAGDGLLNVTVDQGAVRALAHNGGLIQADGGQVLLTAQGAGTLMAGAVNQSGVVQARGLSQRDGRIVLLGDPAAGEVRVSGALDVSSSAAGQAGGTVQVLGHVVTLNVADINASGPAGGGTVLVGGNFHGQGNEPQAVRTTLAGNTRIQADALQAGPGGRIAVWSTGTTAVDATLSARGGALGGDGGLVETSGKQVLLADTTRVDTRAAAGKTGLWELDPVNWTIAAAGGDETPGSVTTSLATSDRLITADNDITVASAVTWTTGQTLELRAGHDVRVNAAMTASTAGSRIVLTAGNDVLVNAAMTASALGSRIVATAGRDVTATAALTASAGGAQVNLTAARTVSADVITANGGGSVNLVGGTDVVVNGLISADTGPVTLWADNDGTGPGVGGGTVRFVGVGAVNAPNTIIRFNPNGYVNTAAEIAAYVAKASALLDARAWTFAQGVDKVYDATTAATLAFRGTPTDGGAVTLVPGSAAFDNKNVGVAKPITYSGYTLGGADQIRFALYAAFGAPSGAGTTTANITPRGLTVTATGTNKVYDGNTTDLVTLTDNRIAGDVLTLANAAANFADPNVGNNKPVAVTGISVTGVDALNYTANTAAVTAANITPAPMTITAADLIKTYGQVANPTAFTQAGLVNGETVGSVTETSAGTPASAPVLGSPYPITPSAATGGTFAASNYTISYVNGALTVAPAPMIITAANLSKTYGQVVTPTAFTQAGLVNGETVGSVTETSTGTPATAPVLGSPYAIVPSAASGGTFTPSNYVITYVNGLLTVLPAPMVITAVDLTKNFGEVAVPTAFTQAGLVNGETVGGATLTSPGTPASATVAGSPYPIIPSAATGGTFTPTNYTIAYVNGALTVIPLAVVPPPDVPVTPPVPPPDPVVPPIVVVPPSPPPPPVVVVPPDGPVTPPPPPGVITPPDGPVTPPVVGVVPPDETVTPPVVVVPPDTTVTPPVVVVVIPPDGPTPPVVVVVPPPGTPPPPEVVVVSPPEVVVPVSGVPPPGVPGTVLLGPLPPAREIPAPPVYAQSPAPVSVIKEEERRVVVAPKPVITPVAPVRPRKQDRN